MDFVLMLTKETSLLPVLFTEYSTLYVHAQATMLLRSNHICHFLCGTRYGCTDVWEKVVGPCAGTEALSAIQYIEVNKKVSKNIQPLTRSI